MALKKPKNKSGEGKKNKKPAKLQRDNNFDEDDTDGNSDVSHRLAFKCW